MPVSKIVISVAEPKKPRRKFNRGRRVLVDGEHLAYVSGYTHATEHYMVEYFSPREKPDGSGMSKTGLVRERQLSAEPKLKKGKN